MNNRHLLFGFDYDGSHGGMRDLHGSFEELNAALSAGELLAGYVNAVEVYDTITGALFTFDTANNAWLRSNKLI